MASTTIQEYLVSLGFKVDETSNRKFRDTLLEVGKITAEFSAGIIAATTAIVALTDRVASQFNSLFYAGQRSGDTVKDLNAISYGFQRVGLSAEQAVAQITGMAQAIATNPGLAEQFSNLGVKGKPGTSEYFFSFIEQMKQQAPYMAAQYASQVGIGFGDLTQYEANLPELRRSTADFEKRQKAAGVDPAKLAEESVAYHRAIEKLSSNFEIFSQKIAGPVLDALTHLVDVINVAFDYFMGGKASEKGSDGRNFFQRQFGLSGTPSAPSVPKLGSGSGAQNAMDYFTGQGYSHEAAAGIVANLQAESGINPTSSGDRGAAYGIGQWHKPRQDEFAKVFGHDIRQSTLAEQLAFVQYELTKGSDWQAHIAGQILHRTGITAAQAGDAVSRLYERPGDVAGQAAARAGLAQQIDSSVVQHNNITITGSGDPHETGKHVMSALERVKRNHELSVRYQRPVVR